MLKNKHAISRSLGLCGDCNGPSEKTICVPCTRKRSARRTPTVRRVCSYCNELGHNKRSCEAHAADMKRFAEIEARFVEHTKTLTPHQPAEWERVKALKDAITHIAGLPRTATTWKAIAQAALRFV